VAIRSDSPSVWMWDLRTVEDPYAVNHGFHGVDGARPELGSS
jgi:hypothetical protein